MSDDIDVLAGYLGRAIRALRQIEDGPQLASQLEVLQEAEGTYLPRLRAAAVKVDLSLRHVEAILGTLESAARTRDVTAAVTHSTAMMSALPGDPTKGLRPPKPRKP
jgi:hypothetical protein